MMESEGTSLGGVSRSGRVRKKSTKLIESMEVNKGPKLERPLIKLSPDKNYHSTFGTSADGDSYLSDAFEVEEELPSDLIKSERLPLSAEGLPLAVPASGYYTYEGQFSNVLPKTESKSPKRIKRDKLDDLLPTGNISELEEMDNPLMKNDNDSFYENTDVKDLNEPVIKKKKLSKYKDKLWAADWEKLKKKKKKKKEKEKLFKALKTVNNEIKPSPCGDIINPDEDSNSGSMSLVIAEPPIPLPPKKRKDETDKKSEAKKKNLEKKKTKKQSSNKPRPEDIIISSMSVPTVGDKLKQLADGGLNDTEVALLPTKSGSNKHIIEKRKAYRKKDKFVVDSDGVVTEKKRRPRPITAYMLFCKENRPKIVAENPLRSKDFAFISRKMGEVWQALADKEKMMFRRRAKKIGRRGSMISTGKKGDGKLQLNRSQGVKKAVSPGGDLPSSSRISSSIDFPFFKVTGTDPIDIAAHLKLLGESLAIIGQRLTENEGQIAVSGTLSVLLDSTLCALAPLFCLTNQIFEMEDKYKEHLASSLDSIAYVMPGL